MADQTNLEQRVEELEKKVKKLEDSFLLSKPSMDELIDDAKSLVKKYSRVSASLLQRTLSIGYARAARLLDELEKSGYISPDDGTNKPRKVLKK